VKKWNKQEAKS